MCAAPPGSMVHPPSRHRVAIASDNARANRQALHDARRGHYREIAFIVQHLLAHLVRLAMPNVHLMAIVCTLAKGRLTA